MYIESVDSFIQQAEDLYRTNPLRTRYVVKYRHCDGKLSLKVTDNVTVCAIVFSMPKRSGLIDMNLVDVCSLGVVLSLTHPLKHIELVFPASIPLIFLFCSFFHFRSVCNIKQTSSPISKS